MNNHLDRGRFEGEGELPGGDYGVPPDLFTADELADMEREAAYMESCYAAEADAEDARHDHLTQPTDALEFLVEAHGGDDCDGECPLPVEVLEVLSVHMGRATSVKARVVCADGKTRIAEGWYSYCGGSRDEPPSQDAGFDYTDC